VLSPLYLKIVTEPSRFRASNGFGRCGIFPFIGPHRHRLFVGKWSHTKMLNDDDEVSYSIDELLKELDTFISDKSSHWFMLSKWQAMLLYGEINSLVDDLEK
jgi:hypothetical protein